MMDRYIHLHPRARLIFISVISLVLVGGALFAFWYMAESVIRSRGVSVDIQSQLDALTRERADAKVVERLLGERKKDRIRIKEFYADAKQPVAFFEDIEALARASGNTLAIDLDEGRSDARHLGLRLTLEGEEKSLLAYVRLLERVPYHVEITEVLYQNLASEASHRAGSPSARFNIALQVRTR